MIAIIETWQAGEWILAGFAAVLALLGLALAIWEFSSGWTPIKMLRHYRHEKRQAKAENRPRHTTYDWGPRMGLAFVLWIIAGILLLVLYL